jgi:subtilisin family serine protease
VPYEEIDLTSPVDSWYYVTISKTSATADHDLNLRSFGPGFLHFQPERSVTVPADSPDALTVGAAFWSDLGLEPFSSRGPTLGPGGTLTGGALKPDLAGADGTSGATYGSSNGAPWPNGTGFFGTSAACPHVAGGAALLLSKLPSLDADLLEATLLWGAQDLGESGPDTGFGHGLMRLDTVLFADGFESGTTSAWSTTLP